MRLYPFAALLLGIAGFHHQANGQTASESAGTNPVQTRIPGKQYQAGWLHKLFFGAHYRELWVTPIEAPVLDLATFAGGLAPIKKGGGQQTKSLRLQGKNGTEYAFRSLDKDPAKAIPIELRETVVASVVQDQISSAHPYSALVVAQLAEALNVLHPNPQLVIMPDNERLGEFRKEFARLLGFIEERPADAPDGEPGFAGSEKIVGTEELFLELAEDQDDVVDAKALLKARLLDIYVGDWDRHIDQWRWARFKEGKKKMWQPIPRDRDQAFAKFDGLLPALAEKRYVVTQLEGFNKETPDIISLTFSGRHIDRNFLNRLTRDDFQEVAAGFVSALTDSVIDHAVQQLPATIFAKFGEELATKLEARRNYMPRAADLYYKNLARYVELSASDQAEFVEIERRKSEVAVRIFKRDKQSGEKEDELLYERVFNNDETKEIRLYLLGGKDKVVLNGEAGESITVRIVAGRGEDEVVDHSKVRGYFLGLIPVIPDAESKTYVYDAASGVALERGPSTASRLGRIDSIANFHDYTPLVRDYGHDTKPLPFLAINADDGLFLGGGALLYRYGFRKQPYSYKMSLRGNFAFKTSAFRIRYAGDFVQFWQDLDLRVDAAAAVPREVRNFYGLGNESGRDENLERDDFYRVKSHEYLLRLMLRKRVTPAFSLSAGGAYKYFKTEFEDTSFTRRSQPYGVATHSLIELGTRFEIDLRNRAIATSRGWYFSAGLSHYPKTLDNDSAFTKASVDNRIYFTPLRPVTLAFHAAGEKVWGTFPFYEAAYAGGNETVRGFRRERFGGDATAFGSAELRLRLFRFKFIFPTDFGLLGFADAGRVWLNDESPGDWHTASGGGVWLAPIYPTFTFSIAGASSVDGLLIVAGGGFMF